MTDEEPYILDIRGLEDADAPARPAGDGLQGADTPPQPAGSERPWIGVQFECCGVYTRIYRNVAGNAYEGFCPKCARPVHVKVGPGGIPQRLFRAR